MRCSFRCSAMKFLVIVGAVFLVFNIAFFFSHISQQGNTGTICDCREKNRLIEKTMQVKAGYKEAKPEAVKPARKEDAKPASNEEAKPRFEEVVKQTYQKVVKPASNEDVKPAFNEKVKPKYNEPPNFEFTMPAIQNSSPYGILKRNSSSSHKLAIVVPFRDRYEEMMKFVPHMHSFLTKQNVSHHIWIISQVDSHRYASSPAHTTFHP